MLGEDSDEDEDMDTTERKRNTSGQDDEMGCTWGMGKTLNLLLGLVFKSHHCPQTYFYQASFHDPGDREDKYNFHRRLPKPREIRLLFCSKTIELWTQWVPFVLQVHFLVGNSSLASN